MIHLTYKQEAEKIFDEMFPERNLDVVIEDDDTLFTLMFEVIELAKYAGYVINKETWDKVGKYIDFRGAFEE